MVAAAAHTELDQRSLVQLSDRLQVSRVARRLAADQADEADEGEAETKRDRESRFG